MFKKKYPWKLTIEMLRVLKLHKINPRAIQLQPWYKIPFSGPCFYFSFLFKWNWTSALGKQWRSSNSSNHLGIFSQKFLKFFTNPLTKHFRPEREKLLGQTVVLSYFHRCRLCYESRVTELVIQSCKKILCLLYTSIRKWSN